MKTVFRRLLILGFILISTWLFAYDKASQPGKLRIAHAGNCENCHIPWRGVENRKCLECHDFGDLSYLRPQIRFHEAGQNCLNCHTEHQGRKGKISRMNHGVLNPELQCTICHVDPHDGLFGAACRECHAIRSWNIEAFQHPEADKRNCNRCHAVPESHLDESFWESIKEGHYPALQIPKEIKPEECWRCHITHRWDHLRMAHDL